MLEELTHDPEPAEDRPVAFGGARSWPERAQKSVDEDDGPALERSTPRKTRYRVKMHLDGAAEVTVTIERGTTHQLVTVRPLGKRGTYTLSLAVVAEMIAFKVAKNQAEELRREKDAGRRAKKFLPRRQR